jgi:hypothetical protein
MPVASFIPSIGLATLGVATGFAFHPCFTYAYWKVACHATGELATDNKTQAITILAALVGSVAAGGSVLVPLYLFGLVPLCDRTQTFFVFWLIGVVLFRMYQWQGDWIAKRNRKVELERSISIEIEERRREQKLK